MNRSLSALVCFLALFACSVAVFAQADDAGSATDATPAVTPEQAMTLHDLGFEIDETLRQRAAVPGGKLAIELVAVPREALEASAAVWMSDLQQLAAQLAGVAASAAPGATPIEGMSPETIEELRSVTSGLAVRVALFLDEIERKGGDVTQQRSYIDRVQWLLTQTEPDRIARIDPSAMSEEERAKADLAERVAAEARRIRNDPPVHVRAEPWAVPVSEFLNELQPLQRDQIDERAKAWLGLLQHEVRKRNRLNIAAEQTEDDALRQALFDQAAVHQSRIQLIVERIQALLEELQRRGGDVSEYRRYVTNVTGVQLNLTDPAVVYAQAMAWLKSPEGGIAVGLRILTFVAILFAAWVVSRIVGRVVVAALNRVPKASNLLREFLAGGAKRTVLLIGLIVAVSRLGVDITPLIAAIGAAGLVIGLALQGTLGNFASGILILIYRPYDVGDFISAGGVSGKVEAMNLVSTRIGTFDNQVMFVPNNQVWGNVITNINGRSTRRVDLVFGIAYDADIAAAERVIREIVDTHDKILKDPEPVIKVHELADSSVNFIVRPWAKVADYWDVYWDVTRRIKERFDAEGIGIPFPQRDLHIPGQVEVVVKDSALLAQAPAVSEPKPKPRKSKQPAKSTETQLMDYDDDHAGD